MEKSPSKHVNFGVKEKILIRRDSSAPPSNSKLYQEELDIELSIHAESNEALPNLNIFIDSGELPQREAGHDVLDFGFGLPPSTEDDPSTSRSCFSKQWFEILLEILSLLFTATDMSFVGILVYRHYTSEASDPLQAWAMLLPIFLSTFGVQLAFERFPPRRHWYYEVLNVPLLGPVFCTGEVLFAKLKPGSEEAHRIEAESIKLKQYESIFRAFPEGMVMLSVLFTDKGEHEGADDWIRNRTMEILCVLFAIVCLAESHWYGIVSDFYRIHDKGRPTLLNHEDRQRPHRLRFWQRSVLFLHAVLAIGLRTFCEGLIRATVYFALNSSHSSPPHPFVEVLLIVFFGEMAARSALHLLAQILRELSVDLYKYLLNPFYVPQFRRRGRGRREGYTRIESRALDGTYEDDEAESYSGIHGAVKHGLLATFSPLQFQSKFLPTVMWFYIENLGFLALWFWWTRSGRSQFDLTYLQGSRDTVFVIYSRELLCFGMTLFLSSLLLQAVVSYFTMPDSEDCVIRIRRVPHRYSSMPGFPSLPVF